MKYFEKTAKKDKEQMNFGELTGRQAVNIAGSSIIPFLPAYLSTPTKIRDRHPAVSTVLGPLGASGAHAKDTGESNLGATTAAGAASYAPFGALIGGVRGRSMASALAGAGLGALAGGVSGATAYGLGHLFGKKTKIKRKKRK